MAITVITPPPILPVTLVQIKQHLRIDHNDEDTVLQEIASSAVDHIEAATGQYLIERTLRQYIDAIPASRAICLEAWPVSSITLVRGFDSDGESQTIDNQFYALKAGGDPAAIVFQEDFPAISYPNGIEVDFVSGHGASGPDVPSNIIRAILVLCEHWFEHRGAQASFSQAPIIPAGLASLLGPARRVKL